MKKRIIKPEFFNDKPIEVAKNLLGKFICRKFDNGTVQRWCITETEAYDDKEKVTYTNEMFLGVGEWCPYSGMIMINCHKPDPNHDPNHDNVLIRALDCVKGPCKIVDELRIKEISNEIMQKNVLCQDKLWLEDWGITVDNPEPGNRKGLTKNKTSEEEKAAHKNFEAKVLHYPFEATE